MIFVKGYGQMCNNILQYAHIYAWGRENHIKVVSMRFAYKYQYFKLCDYWYHNWLTYLFAKLLISLRLIKHLWLEQPEEITPEAIESLKHDKLIAISGWSFRFPELFFKYESKIRDMFAFKAKVKKPVDAFFQACEPHDIRLAIHIRRGDYATFMGGKFFYGDDVYIRLINEFIALHPDKKVSVFICTNDKMLNIALYKQQTGVPVHLFRGNEAEDLYLLSQCDYIMGAKSTFSLVAAFYRHVPIYHITDKDKALTEDSFQHFEDLFMGV